MDAREPADPMDFLLGYALHDDPAGVIADVIKEELQRAEEEGRKLYVVASVCGSDLDPQDYTQQAEKLKQSGVLLAPDNGTAAHWAIELASAFKGGV